MTEIIFNGCTTTECDDDKLTFFANFGLDNRTIDDYFNDEGDKIADMCGTTTNQMGYEWKWMCYSSTMAYQGLQVVMVKG